MSFVSETELEKRKAAEKIAREEFLAEVGFVHCPDGPASLSRWLISKHQCHRVEKGRI